MQFIDNRLGEFRIYVGALDGAQGQQGFSAALVVMHERPGGAPVQCFRDESLACGYRWPSAEQAMSYAMARGRELVRRGQFESCDAPAGSERAAA
jgi:hypothetical protein